MKTGDVYTWKRTFTNEEVLEFGRISGDKGRHHVEPDENGRLMVQGLLTASIGTKIGGDLHYIARNMVNEFLRPVFTGDTITCEVNLEKVVQKDGHKKVEMKSVYRNQKGSEVLVGSSYGIIRD
ncbi:MaoC family dehydratase N-terminal domain-containing protein [Halobacillus trueperi]|uniref:FAS1-like dehydratase domain-containing protein n=1 Tax=Halobacillus trueperi TaxID=156205 RepID=UPI003735DCA8